MTHRMLATLACWTAVSTPSAGQAALGTAVQDIRTAMAAGNHETSTRIADSLWRSFPGHPSLVILRAQTFAAAGRLDDAERDVRKRHRLRAGGRYHSKDSLTGASSNETAPFANLNC